MEVQKDDLFCKFCKKKYSSITAKKIHMQNFHPKIPVEFQTRTKRIICPLCSVISTTHINFRKHLLDCHNINVKVSTLNFLNFEEFQCWRTQDGREENYSCFSNKKTAKGIRNIVYNCIRSKAKGSESKAKVRQPPARGSQFINGFCPSRIIVKIAVTGEVSVEYVETHVGHNDEICYKRLTKIEENKIKDQLTAGVTIDKILQVSRVVEDNTLKKINVLTRVDLNRIIKRHNIGCQRHPNDLITTSIKVEENISNNQVVSNFSVSNMASIEETDEEKCARRAEEVKNNISNALARLNCHEQNKYFDDIDQLTMRYLNKTGGICQKRKEAD